MEMLVRSLSDMSIRQDYPILEFDPDRNPVIDIDLEEDAMPGMPEHCVMCWFRDVFETLAERGRITLFKEFQSEMGAHPLYLYTTGERTIALLHQAVGAPLAAALLEETIAVGGRKFIACGGAGVLDRTVTMGQLLVPTAAVRDEGTSYHYLPPAREVEPTPAAVAAIESVLTRRKIDYVLTKTWTTDAYFRETRDKVALRREEGCLTVEMEAAALFAVARYRGVEFGQVLYGGDNLDADQWEHRDWIKNQSVREMLVQLAAEACLAL